MTTTRHKDAAHRQERRRMSPHCKTRRGGEMGQEEFAAVARPRYAVLMTDLW